MNENNVNAFPNIVTPQNPIIFNPEACVGCNTCVEICVMDILLPNPEKGQPPIVLYPEECYYDGLCVINCPQWQKGAIKLNHGLNQRVRWKRKSTGEHFRLGMPKPPPPNTQPPVSGWKAKS